MVEVGGMRFCYAVVCMVQAQGFRDQLVCVGLWVGFVSLVWLGVGFGGCLGLHGREAL